MGVSFKKAEEALNILLKYEQNNPEIRRLRYKVENDKNFTLSELNYEYILCNYDKTEPISINKTIKIAKWFGEQLQKKYDIEFIPEKLKISNLIGETSLIYHCYVIWRKQQTSYISMFIPKKALLNPLFENNFKDTEIDIDKLNRMLEPCDRKIQPHQIDAIKFLLSRKKCILADTMGLCKTNSSISASILGNFEHILIISPASVKSTWKKEISFFGINDVSILEGISSEKWDLTKKYVICNFDIFNEYLHEVAYDEIIDKYTGKIKKIKSRNKEKIKEINSKNPLINAYFDLIIVDEVHKLSNSTSGKYKAIYDYVTRSKSNNVFLLSGTPITNNHKNFYNILQLIGSEVSNDYRYYMKQYCGGFEITLKTGKKVLIGKDDTNSDELRERTKHLYLRREKKDIPNFPKSTVLEKYYDLTNNERKEYNKLWEEYEQAQINLGNVDVNTLSDLNRQLVEGGILRQYLAKLMVKNTIKLAESWIEGGSKVVIGCWYKEEVNLLEEYFKERCVVYRSGMTTKQKDKIQDSFNDNPKIDVIITNILVGGVGISLISTVKNRPSNVLIMNSFDYVPGNNSQFLDRISRFGVKWDVNCYFMLFNDTYNEFMWNKVIKKMMVIDTVIKDEKNK